MMEKGEGFHILLKYLSDVIVQRHLFYREVGDVGNNYRFSENVSLVQSSSPLVRSFEFELDRERDPERDRLRDLDGLRVLDRRSAERERERFLLREFDLLRERDRDLDRDLERESERERDREPRSC
jgi:hypothetical protein